MPGVRDAQGGVDIYHVMINIMTSAIFMSLGWNRKIVFGNHLISILLADGKKVCMTTSTGIVGKQ